MNDTKNSCVYCGTMDIGYPMVCIECDGLNWGCSQCFNKACDTQFFRINIPCITCRRKLRDSVIDSIIEHK